jgi:hypothetical protein
MVAPYPVVDPRRARALAAELEAMARSLAPGWCADPGSGDAGRAVLEIAARLAEHVTRRLDETPRRDALAFFDLLEVPPPAARAALAPVVFTLAEKRTTPVVAPERTQLTATAEGEELIFETTTALTLTPARLARLVTVDGRQDRIEEAPLDVIQAIPPSGLPTTFAALTFAAAGSRSIQLTPSIGLEPGQLVRILGAAYRVKDAARTGMVELFEPLEAPLAAGDPVTRITRLESFSLRDRQAHIVMIGHAELFDLEGPAIITLELEPPSLASALMNLDLAIELYAVAPPAEDEDAEAAEADAPDWHELTPLGTEGGHLRLAKTWTGKVEELEQGGHKSRWLRLRLRDPITDEPEPVRRLRKLAIGVESLDLGALPTEGAVGLTAANSNGNPLPLTTAFLPFGAEPQRFDVFAFAAPEMLTKRGAEARLELTLQDGSLQAFAIGGGGPNTIPLAIGGDGKLRAMALGSDGKVGVTLLGKPGQADLPVPLEATSSLRLTAIATLPPGQDPPESQFVAARDQGGRIWVAGVDEAEDGSIEQWADWQLVADADAQNPVREIVLLPGSPPLLVARRDDGLWARGTLPGSAQHFPWQRLQPPVDPETPDFVEAGQLVPVQDSTGDLLRELVLIDAKGAVFSIQLDLAGSVVSWQRVGRAAAGTDIRPAAARLPDDALLIHAADKDRRLLTIVDGESESPPPAFADLTLLPGTALHLAAHQSPVALERPILLAFAARPNGTAVVILHHAPFTPEVVPLEAVLPPHRRAKGTPPAVGGLVATERGPLVVLAGEHQSLAGREVSGAAVEATFHDFLRLPAVPGIVTDAPLLLVEVAGSTLVALEPPVGEDAGRAIHALPAGTLVADGSYRVLRQSSQGEPFQGEATLGDDGTWSLALDDDDAATIEGAHLHVFLGPTLGRIMEVEAIADGDPRIATLIGSLEGLAGSVQYRAVQQVSGPVAIDGDQLRTLVALPASVTDVPPALRLRADITPGVQMLEAVSGAGDPPWAIAQSPWQAPPPATTTALLLPPAAQAWQASAFKSLVNNPALSFEYWNGSSWARLGEGFSDGTDNLAQSGIITFTVPPDIASTEIAGHDDYWIRVRLVGGDYGRPVYQATSKTNDDGSITQSITVDTSNLAPPEIRRMIAGFTLDQRRPAERLLVEGNLSLVDQTQAAASPSATVTLFASAAVPAEAASGAPGRALFLGFTRPFDVQQLSLWVEAEEQGTETGLRAHVLERGGWRPVAIEDETRGLDRSGFIHVFASRPPRPERLFGEERFWLCFAPAEPAADWQPVVAGLYPNAARALHAETIEQEILGTSRGEPGQRHDLARTPILTESLELRVREQLAAEERGALVGAGGPAAVTRYTERGITGDWVRWERRDSFIGAAPDARVFTVTAAGEVRFGDNREGRIPPPGRDVIRAIRYQRGGGEIGNIEAYAIADVKSALESVEAVANPVAAAGGVDSAGLDNLLETAPTRLRHAGEALTPADLEALARDFSTDIRNARCLGATRPGGPIRLVVAWRNGDARCPVPTRVQREALARHLALTAWGALVPTDIEVVPPRWVELAVEVKLRAGSGELAASLQIAAMERLTAFLDPLDGGPDGKGWPFGRPVFTSDLAALLLPVPGLAEIMGIKVEPETLPPDGLICADPEREAIRLEVTVGLEERAL